MKLILKISLLLLLPCFAKAQVTQQTPDSLHSALRRAANDSIRMATYTSLATYYLETNRDSAFYFTDQLLELSRKLNQPIWTAYGLLTKAYIYQKQANYPMVFKFTNEALDIAKDEKSEKNIYLNQSLDIWGYIPSDPFRSHRKRLSPVRNSLFPGRQ